MRYWVLTAAMLAMPFAADAQSYRCTGKDGKKYYGATIPDQCIGQMVEQLSPQGVVVRRIEAPMTSEQREKRDADAKASAEKDSQAKEDARRNRALLATYQSEKDIEIARQRALEDNEKAIKEIGGRIDELKKRQAGYQKEMEFYKGKNKPPAKFEQDVKATQHDLKTQEDQIALRKNDVNNINAKYDEDKRRFLELSGKDVRERAAATGVEKKTYVRQSELPKVTSKDFQPRTAQCGNTTVVCDAVGTVLCNGKPIRCQ